MEIMLFLQLVFLVPLVICNDDVSNGIKDGQQKEVAGDTPAGNRDQITKNKDEKINEERNIEVIDQVLDHFFENEEEGSATGNDYEQEEEALKFFVSTKTKTLKTTTTSTRSITSYHTCYKANPELPFCNRKKRHLTFRKHSTINVEPNVHISLIQKNGDILSVMNETKLTWQDVISPSRVARGIQTHSSTSIVNYKHKGVGEGGSQQEAKQILIAKGTPLKRIQGSSTYQRSNAEAVKLPINPDNIVEDRTDESPLNLPLDSFGDKWIEREIEGLDRRCYDSGSFARRFITILMTSLVTETAFETTFVESNQVNTVYFNLNHKNEGCLPSDVAQFFTSSCL